MRSARAHVVVFVKDVPTPGVRVLVDGRDEGVVTNEDGAADVEVAKTGTRTLRFVIPPEALPAGPGGPVGMELPHVEFVIGETIEIIVTLTAAGEIDTVALEGAGARAAEIAAAEAFRKAQAERPRGTLVGQVVGVETQQPVAGAQVFVRGTMLEARTDATGAFKLELPEGQYDLSVIHASFSTQSQSGVVVQGGQTTRTRIELSPASVELETFVVLAPHIEGSMASLVQERRESSAVSDVIGAQEMSRAGASDAAGALRRVTGINVVGGRFIYVRGMGERYSSTLLNGQLAPSPDPERRVIPLDLFPIQVLEGVLIQKTFSPDLPAEFGGGAVQLRTRSYPDRFVFNLGIQGGLTTSTTFTERPAYEGGRLDWLGTDDGTRTLPENLRTAGKLRQGNPLVPGFSKDDLAGFGRQLPNIWNVRDERVPVDKRLALTIGDRFKVGEVPIGVLASGIYSDSYQWTLTENRFFNASAAAEGGLALQDDVVINNLTRTISSAAILTAGSEYLPGQKLSATSLLLRVTDDSTDLVTGNDEDLGVEIRRARLRFQERQLFTQQVSGQQTLPFLNQALLDWRYGYSTALLDDPDRREYVYIDTDRRPDVRDFQIGEGTTRNYTDLKDELHNAGLDYTQPYGLASWLAGKAKLGGLWLERTRDVQTIRYVLDVNPRLIPTGVKRQSPEEIFQPAHYDGSRGIFIQDATQASDAYRADQTLQAGYLMTETSVHKAVDVMLGSRVERSRQQVTTFDPFDPSREVRSVLDNLDVLPAATAAYRLSGESLIRAGYGRTVSRPDFRELSPAPFLDVTTKSQFVGNPDLQRATIENYDLRMEHYFSAEELISAGVFYKHFENPIEVLIQGGTQTTFTWANAEAANNYGVEVEFRRQLGWLVPDLGDLYVASNVAFIRSQIDLGANPGAATSTKRALQGQAPYVVNAQIGYDDTVRRNLGTTVTLLYNITGPWIAQAGRFNAPDTFQEPFHQLDITFSQRLPMGFLLTARALNLLDPTIDRTQGGRLSQRFRLGRAIAVGLQWGF
jgi:hypothetical protein